MLNRIVTIVLFIIVIIFFSCNLGEVGFKSNTYHTIINGIVLEEINDAHIPVDSMKVIMDQRADGFKANYNTVGIVYSDSLGKFNFDVTYTSTPDDGVSANYRLRLSKSGYFERKYGSIKAGEVNDITVYHNTYVRYYRTIAKGNFIEKDTTQPIEGVNVFLKRDLSGNDRDSVVTGQSNSNGNFYLEDNYFAKIEDISFRYEFQYQAEGYDRPSGRYGLSADSTKEYLIELTPVTD